MNGMVLIKKDKAVQYKPAFPTLPKGMDMAVLSGDPAKAGEPFTLRVTVPKHWTCSPGSSVPSNVPHDSTTVASDSATSWSVTLPVLVMSNR